MKSNPILIGFLATVATAVLAAQADTAVSTTTGPATAPASQRSTQAASQASQPTSAPTGVRALDGNIPWVRSLAELREAKPVGVIDGWEIRLGLAGGGEGATWRLIYCHARREGGGEMKVGGTKRYRDQALGPVKYVVTQKKHEPYLEVMDKLEEVAMQRRMMRAEEVVFCGIVPTPDADKYQIKVLKPDGHEIAQASFEVKDEPAALWCRQLRRTRDHYVLEAGPIARPEFENDEPVWSLDKSDDFAKCPAGKLKDFLPGQLPREGKWVEYFQATCPELKLAESKWPFPLEISLDSGKLKLVLPEPFFLPYRLHDHLLARWWVNGEPLKSWSVTLRDEMQQLEKAEKATCECTLDMVLPAGINAKAGDKIAVQFLLSPGEVVETQASKMKARALEMAKKSKGRADCLPMLSNKLEFKATKEMVKAEKQKEEEAQVEDKAMAE